MSESENLYVIIRCTQCHGIGGLFEACPNCHDLGAQGQRVVDGKIPCVAHCFFCDSTFDEDVELDYVLKRLWHPPGWQMAWDVPLGMTVETMPVGICKKWDCQAALEALAISTR